MTNYQRIVCATDFSPASELAVSRADDLAKRLGATLHLLHVVLDPLQEAWTAEGFALGLGDLVEARVREAELKLEALAAKCASTTVTACRVGRPVQQILDYVGEVKGDLLVVGSHGHGFVAHMLLGSVAERVIRQAPCPVLTVRGSSRPEHASETAASATGRA
jgi:universal stress protein A